jgi:FKBP-type peptidyl-prolyl cis-trans isomerase
MRFSFLLVFVLAAAVSGCKSTPTSPSQNQNVPYSQVDLVVGTGTQAQTGSLATVAYAGWLYDANAADNKGASFDPGGQFQFTVGAGVITGFSQMVNGMRVGGRRRAIIPPNLAYGAAGSPPSIPSNATLVFEVVLLSIQ